MAKDAKYCAQCGEMRDPQSDGEDKESPPGAEEKESPPVGGEKESAPDVAPVVAARTFDFSTANGLPSPVQPTQRPAWLGVVAALVVVIVATALWFGLRSGGDPISASGPTGGADTSQTTVVSDGESGVTSSDAASSQKDSPSGSSTTTVVSTTTTTGAPATTVVTEALALEIFNTVNGLAAESEVFMNRRAVAVAIDDHGSARPQAGLAEADLVYEMLIEGGVTRFAAVFHQSDLDWVGPVHSGRVTNVGALRWLDGAFQMSGAQAWVRDVYRAEGLRALSDTGASTFREQSRRAPHNLYTSTLLIRDQADSLGWPDGNPGNVFDFGVPTGSDTPATEVRFDWSDQPDVIWRWNGEAYERYNAETPHTSVTEETKAESGEIVTTPMIVVIKGSVRLDQSPAGEGTPLPTTETIGEGDALVFANGTVVEGVWQRDDYAEKFVLMTTDGTPIVLRPSKMWIVIFPDNRAVSWE